MCTNFRPLSGSGMDDTVILHRTVRADHNGAVVPAEPGTRADVAVLAKAHITDDAGGWPDVASLSDNRFFPRARKA